MNIVNAMNTEKVKKYKTGNRINNTCLEKVKYNFQGMYVSFIILFFTNAV